MSPRYCVDPTADVVRPRIVTLKRSRSHHHHHHRHHRDRDHGHDRCYVTKDDWNSVLERERHLVKANDALERENHELRCKLHDADLDLRRYEVWVPQLQRQVQVLADENEYLRRSVDSAGHHSERHHREAERMRSRLCKVEREAERLRARVSELMRQTGNSAAGCVEELRETIRAWKCKFEAVDDHNKRVRKDLDYQRSLIGEQNARIAAYEQILRRHNLLC